MDKNTYSQLVKQAYAAYAAYDAAEAKARKSELAAQAAEALVVAQVEAATKNWNVVNPVLPLYMMFVVAPKMGRQNIVSFGGAKGYIKAALRHLPKEINVSNREKEMWFTDDHINEMRAVARQFLPQRMKAKGFQMIHEFPIWMLLKAVNK